MTQEQIQEAAKEYANDYVLTKHGDLFSNNNDEAGNAFGACTDSFLAGYSLAQQEVAELRTMMEGWANQGSTPEFIINDIQDYFSRKEGEE